MKIIIGFISFFVGFWAGLILFFELEFAQDWRLEDFILPSVYDGIEIDLMVYKTIIFYKL